MINAILDSGGRAPDVSAGSFLSVAHVLKDKTTGAEANQWPEQR